MSSRQCPDRRSSHCPRMHPPYGLASWSASPIWRTTGKCSGSELLRVHHWTAPGAGGCRDDLPAFAGRLGPLRIDRDRAQRRGGCHGASRRHHACWRKSGPGASRGWRPMRALGQLAAGPRFREQSTAWLPPRFRSRRSAWPSGRPINATAGWVSGAARGPWRAMPASSGVAHTIRSRNQSVRPALSRERLATVHSGQSRPPALE